MKTFAGKKKQCSALTEKSFDSWLGFAFERFCLKNAGFLSRVMGFEDEALLASPYFEKNGVLAAYLASDEGSGLRSAQKEALSKSVWQPDTYHAIAHRLGLWMEKLERAAYKAIRNEDGRYKKLDSARKDHVILKRINQFEEARKIADEEKQLLEEYDFLPVSDFGL